MPTTRSMVSQPITPPQPMTPPYIQRPITRSMASQPMTPPHIERTREPPPAPSKIGLDLSKMPKKPNSAPFVIAKSTEQQLADALAENEKFRETVNRLVDTHNARADELDALKKQIAKLMKKYEAYEKEAAQAKKDARITTMLDTGLDEMVYHLGFCSDVLGDSWVPEYEAGGLAGLKKILRESSTYVHGKSCSTCDKFIGSIHD